MFRNYLFISSFFVPVAFAADPLNDTTISSINNFLKISQDIQLEANRDYTSDGSSASPSQWLKMYDNNQTKKSLEINSNDYLVTIENYHPVLNGKGTNGSVISSKGDVSLIGNYTFQNNISENTDSALSGSGTNDVQGGVLHGQNVKLKTGINGSLLFQNNKIITPNSSSATAYQVNAYGGAIRASSLNIIGEKGTKIKFEGNEIHGNTTYGGAIYVSSSLNLSGESVTYSFTNNLAQSNKSGALAGAIYISAGNNSARLDASNSIYKFDGNTVESLNGSSAKGGAIATAEGGSSPMKIYLNGDNSRYSFTNNSAESTVIHNPGLNSGYGGAINVGGELYLNNTTSNYVFDNNKVSADRAFGGAISMITFAQLRQAGYKAKLELTNTTMTNNSVVSNHQGSDSYINKAYGGAIYAYGADVTISGNSLFSGNSTTAANSVTNSKYVSAYGGAVYSTSAIETINGGKVADNIDVTMDFVTNSGETITFKDNYTMTNGFKADNDIYWDGAATGGSHTVTIQTDANSKIEMLSSIGSSSVANVDINKFGDGTWVLGKNSVFAGKTNIAINQGVLELTDSNSTITLDNTNGSTFSIGQNGNLVGNYGIINSKVTNNGTIYINNSATTTISGTPGLMINGDYVGNNGTLILNSVLGNDSSPTEQLVINGNATGTTNVTINNLGGLGAQTIEGIKIIDITGNSAANAFTADNIVAGAYEYTLQQGNARPSSADTQSWYLTSLSRSGPIVRPAGGSYLANLVAANNIFNLRLHDRLGETQYTDLITGEDKVTSMWLRARYGYDKYKDGSGQLSIKNNWNFVQLGGDVAEWSSDNLDRFHLGLMGGYGHSSNKTTSNVSDRTGKSNIDGYSAGIYGTWYSNDEDKVGLYVDSWLQWSRFDATVDIEGASSEKYKLKGFSVSVESGYSLLAKEWENYNLWLQPKGQLTWSDVTSARHVESNGTVVTSDKDMIQSRLGLKMTWSNNDSVFAKMNQRGQIFMEANWLHNFNIFEVKMNDTSVNQAGARNIGEVKLGVEGDIAKNTNLWFNVAFQAGEHDYENASIMLGAKYSF
ncbi:autotransporter outer membrane beta-barrel domain-containing protein [Orbus mooreae]|uniref:autotransporter outer membrane beta-barrel domain-containing protein n=1 Tax=Orbus mooreae TaxID=3074107 RepID=UPI00370DA5F4